MPYFTHTITDLIAPALDSVESKSVFDLSLLKYLCSFGTPSGPLSVSILYKTLSVKKWKTDCEIHFFDLVCSE